MTSLAYRVRKGSHSHMMPHNQGIRKSELANGSLHKDAGVPRRFWVNPDSRYAHPEDRHLVGSLHEKQDGTQFIYKYVSVHEWLLLPTDSL